MAAVGSHPLGVVLGVAWSAVRERQGSNVAYNWPVRANPLLGGRTPVQALKEGDTELVLRVAREVPDGQEGRELESLHPGGR